MSHIKKPLTLIVHGAWHRPAHYRALISALQARGHTVLAPPLASSGYDDSIDGKDHTDDVRRIHEVLLPYLDAGREAVVVAHSAGGLPATEAVEHHTVSERKARGLPGGIVAIIYISAVPTPTKGVSLFDAGGREWRSLYFHDVGETKLPLKEAAAEVFFHDIEPSVRQEAVALLCGQSRTPFETPLTYTMQEIQIPKTYVVCTLDRANPPEIQQFAATTGEARTVELECGHSPFLKDAERDVLVKLVVEASGRATTGVCEPHP